MPTKNKVFNSNSLEVQPVFIQVAESLLSDLFAGRYGGRVPEVASLAHEYGVKTACAQRAIQYLRQKQWIEEGEEGVKLSSSFAARKRKDEMAIEELKKLYLRWDAWGFTTQEKLRLSRLALGVENADAKG